jgi:hypothetical protein
MFGIPMSTTYFNEYNFSGLALEGALYQCDEFRSVGKTRFRLRYSNNNHYDCLISKTAVFKPFFATLELSLAPASNYWVLNLQHLDVTRQEIISALNYIEVERTKFCTLAFQPYVPTPPIVIPRRIFDVQQPYHFGKRTRKATALLLASRAQHHQTLSQIEEGDEDEDTSSDPSFKQPETSKLSVKSEFADFF